MSIFRPLNSDESNLFTIRCVVEWEGNITDNKKIAGGNNITVDTNLLKTPTANNLPSNFVMLFSGNKFYVQYGKQFTSCPSISIQPRLKDPDNLSESGSAAHVPIPIMYWNNITDYAALGTNGAITTSVYNFAFSFRDTANALITPESTASNDKLKGFDLIITGPVKLGVTTGNSNKGWAVGSGNDATNAYTFMNVGIGVGNPSSALQVQGRLDSFIYKAVTPTTGSGNSNVTLTAAETVCEVLNFTPVNSSGIVLTTLTAANIIAALLAQKNHTAAVNDAFNLVINNLSNIDGRDITLTVPSDNTSNGVVTIVGNPIIHARDDAANAVSVGTATFRYIITAINDGNSGSERVTIIRIA
tara:strand:- start:1762 stop:2838 length:1077 start_codon:yes stop_codon:yes gene_type:complete